MNPEDNLRTAVEAFNRHDPSGWAATYASDAAVHDPFYREPLTGRAAIQQDTADFLRAFPDAHFEVVRTVLTNGRAIAAEFVVTGTHQGPLATPDGEIPPTGKAVRFEGGAFTQLNPGGEAVEEHRYYDLAGLIAQLGLK